MLTPDAIASLAALGFSFDAEPCPVRYIVEDIEAARWASDDGDARVASAIYRALNVVYDGGWVPVAA